MPRLDREAKGAGPVVSGFVGNGFRVEGGIYDKGLWLTPSSAAQWDAPAIAAIEIGALEPLLGLNPPPEFLLLGTGASLRRPTPAFTAAIEARGIGVEPMDSRAAARAWGVLRAEERWIVAALLPLDR